MGAEAWPATVLERVELTRAIQWWIDKKIADGWTNEQIEQALPWAVEFISGRMTYDDLLALIRSKETVAVREARIRAAARSAAARAAEEREFAEYNEDRVCWTDGDIVAAVAGDTTLTLTQDECTIAVLAFDDRLGELRKYRPE